MDRKEKPKNFDDEYDSQEEVLDDEIDEQVQVIRDGESMDDLIWEIQKNFKQYAYDNGLPLFENMTFEDLDNFLSS